MSLWSRHKIFETNSIILVIGVLFVISIGGLVEIVPLFYLKSTIEKVEGVRPYTPLEPSRPRSCSTPLAGAQLSRSELLWAPQAGWSSSGLS
jgi:hypothetical protein